MPGRFGANENMACWATAWIVVENSERESNFLWPLVELGVDVRATD